MIVNCLLQENCTSIILTHFQHEKMTGGTVGLTADTASIKRCSLFLCGKRGLSKTGSHSYLEIIPLDFLIQSLAGNGKQLGGSGFVAPGAAHGLIDQYYFEASCVIWEVKVSLR